MEDKGVAPGTAGKHIIIQSAKKHIRTRAAIERVKTLQAKETVRFTFTFVLPAVATTELFKGRSRSCLFQMSNGSGVQVFEGLIRGYYRAFVYACVQSLIR